MFRAAVSLGVLIAAVSAADAESVLLPYWTPVPIRFTQAISSRDAMLGPMVDAEIADDVVVNGRTVFHKGLPVWADICDVKKKASFGDAGRIEVKVVFAPAGSKSVRIAGRVKSKGARGVTGADAAGTTLLAHVDEKKAVDVNVTRLASAS